MEEEYSNQDVEGINQISQNLHQNQLQQQDKLKQQNHPCDKHLQQFMIQKKSKQLTRLPVSLQQSIPVKVRNRRFKKLLELRSEGFFDQEPIKLRHPLLYYLFVGQYDFEENQNYPKELDSYSLNQPNLLSFFLSNHLINIEYRNLLSQQMTSELQRILEIEKKNCEEQIRRIKYTFTLGKSRFNPSKNQFASQIISSKSQIPLRNPCQKQQENIEVEISKFEEMQELSSTIRQHIPTEEQIAQVIKNSNFSIEQKYNKIDPSNKQLLDPELVSFTYEKVARRDKLNEQQKQIQQQHLIEYCEELFLEGKLSHLQQINYNQIDNNHEYDYCNEENQDLEQKYFDEIEEQMEAGSQQYFTGIQDF